MVLMGLAERIVIDPQTVAANRSLRSALAQLAHADACASGRVQSLGVRGGNREPGRRGPDHQRSSLAGEGRLRRTCVRINTSSRQDAQIPVVLQSGFCHADVFRVDREGSPAGSRRGSRAAVPCGRAASVASQRNAARSCSLRGVRTHVGPRSSCSSDGCLDK